MLKMRQYLLQRRFIYPNCLLSCVSRIQNMQFSKMYDARISKYKFIHYYEDLHQLQMNSLNLEYATAFIFDMYLSLNALSCG